MIFGKELSNLLDGTVVNSKTLKTNYGKQNALDLYLTKCRKKQLEEFPLVFWVTSKVKDTGRTYECSSRLVIMTNTSEKLTSKNRNAKTFEALIHPIYEKIIPMISKSKLKIVGARKTSIEYEDILNYGLDTNLGNKPKEKVNPYFIDARIIYLTLEIQKSCQ